jgi:lysophospholipase L1-like esterase
LRVNKPEPAQLLNEHVLGPLAEAHPEQLTVVDLAAAVCPEGRFTNQLHGIDPFRPDGIHFSPAGRGWVADWLGPQLVDD